VFKNFDFDFYIVKYEKIERMFGNQNITCFTVRKSGVALNKIYTKKAKQK